MEIVEYLEFSLLYLRPWKAKHSLFIIQHLTEASEFLVVPSQGDVYSLVVTALYVDIWN